MHFADIILPIPIQTPLTYTIPSHLQTWVQVGSRVMVPLHKKKNLTGIVVHRHNVSPPYTTKAISGALPELPIVTPTAIQFYTWLANYYLCSLGDVLHAVLFSGLQLVTKPYIELSRDYPLLEPSLSLTQEEQHLISLLSKKGKVCCKDIHNMLPESIATAPTVQSLSDKKIITTTTITSGKCQANTVKHIWLHEQYVKQQEILLTQLKNKPKQYSLVAQYLRYVNSHPTTIKEGKYGIIPKKIVQNWGSPSSLQTLIKDQVFMEEASMAIPPSSNGSINLYPIQLSQGQNQALQSIKAQFITKDVVLLHGVTGSGKTALYINLISPILARGGQVLFLLPEIALTAQIVVRLEKVFGHKVVVYHSKMSQSERITIWQYALQGISILVVGARSAVLLSFTKLHFIIVDEEHELSYKQDSPAPRYHARDASIMLAQFHKAKVILGSATPAIETYYNAQQGKYGLVTLTERFGKTLLPEIVFANLQIAQQRKALQEHFSNLLLYELKQVLGGKGQAMIFQNRRGYASHITCTTCGWIPMCAQCAVSLTYHQHNNYLCCHYCDYQRPPVPHCGACGVACIQHVGFGTEKLEEFLQLLFPDKQIQRMDLDTTQGKYSYGKIIAAFEQGATDILVGTQMITKGLDFEKVALVGVLDVDRMLYFPDFRANERCFQVLTQVSGRAGRRGQRGKVVIQTKNPDHPIFQYVMTHNYAGMYAMELAERQQFLYPPYVRLVKIILKYQDEQLVQAAGQLLVDALKQTWEREYILGPQRPLIAKVKNQHIVAIWIKLAIVSAKELGVQKGKIYKIGKDVFKKTSLQKVGIYFDVDPV